MVINQSVTHCVKYSLIIRLRLMVDDDRSRYPTIEGMTPPALLLLNHSTPFHDSTEEKMTLASPPLDSTRVDDNKRLRHYSSTTTTSEYGPLPLNGAYY